MNSCGFNFDTSYIKLPDQFFTKLNPQGALNPQMIVLNDKLASSIGLDFSKISISQLANLFSFSGKLIPKDAVPFSQAYAGHQFGHFTILGDGRAHILGEHISPDGKKI